MSLIFLMCQILIKLVIKDKLIINKNDYLQSKETKMDAQNYYIQS